MSLTLKRGHQARPHMFAIGLCAWALLLSDPVCGESGWRFTTGGAIPGRPAVSRGVVYAPSEDRYLYSITAEAGAMVWRAYLTDQPNGSIVVSPDGTIYVGTRREGLIAINSRGRELWRLRLSGEIVGDPSVDRDGVLYVAQRDSFLAVLSHRGETRYTVALPARPSTGPVLGPGGIAIVGGVDRNLYGVDTSGSIVWNAVLAGVPSTIALGGNNTCFVGTDYGTLVAIDARTGAILWDRVTNGPLLPPVVFQDDVVFANQSGLVARHRPDGSRVWEYRVPTSLVGTISIDESGAVLVRDASNLLLRVDESGEVGASVPLADGTSSFVVDETGLIVVGSKDWAIYAHASESKPASGWSQDGRDASHNGVGTVGPIDDVSRDPEHAFLIELIRSGGYQARRKAISDMADIVIVDDLGFAHRQHMDVLRLLAADGLTRVERDMGQGVSDYPDIRAAAVKLMPRVAGIRTNEMLGNLIRYEYDSYAVAAYMMAIGEIGSDPTGAATRAIAEYIFSDIVRSSQPDERTGQAAIRAVGAIIEYHGEPSDPIGLTLLIEIFRADYPRSVQELALEVIRSIRYY